MIIFSEELCMFLMHFQEDSVNRIVNCEKLTENLRNLRKIFWKLFHAKKFCVTVRIFTSESLTLLSWISISRWEMQELWWQWHRSKNISSLPPCCETLLMMHCSDSNIKWCKYKVFRIFKEHSLTWSCGDY